MICAICGEATASDPCHACQRSPLLDHRYRLEWVVDRSPRGITWRGTRVRDGLAVAVKKVPVEPGGVGPAANREIAVLRQLAHPRIPAYLDRIVAGVGEHRGVYLIQSFVGGRTLAAEMVDRRHREEEVLALCVEVASILTYLHDLRPRVVHGKVEPGNIIRRAGDGALMLVDFAAVHDGADAADATLGTYGFAAPERYRGETGPASDLYALGVTAAILLTRQPVDALGEHAANWRRFVRVHPETAALLDGLLAAEPTQRFDDARRVMAWGERAIAAIRRDRRAALRDELGATQPMIHPRDRPVATGEHPAAGEVWSSETDEALLGLLATGIAVAFAALWLFL